MKRIKIVYADDEQLMRKTVTAALEPFGIESIGEASNGRELLNLLQVQRPDVILLNLEMQIMDGNKALNSIKERFPGTRVIIVSRYSERGVVENYIRRGVKGFMIGDIVSNDIKKLAEGIHKVAQGRTAFYAGEISNLKVKYTKRETDVIPLICQGKTSCEIGAQIGVSEKRISNIRNGLYRKTNSRNSTEFIQYCLEHGLLYMGKR
jgi:DNA-binding NarL/FixJ family response regulator